MLRTTTLPQTAADQPGLTKHEAAIIHTLAWADEAAVDSEEQLRKRAAWALARRSA